MAAANEAGDAAAAEPPQPAPIPTVALIIGMAGSGKTTLVQQLNAHLRMRSKVGYFINMDPAVQHLPYEPHVDIRDTVNYKKVMTEYKLGPNGGILTACNLFATRFDQVMSLCEQPREPPLDLVVVDTAGQIEIFTWSASGGIVTELFASSMPTVVVFVVDTPRCMNPQTFMSNMMQACSILYKTRLPIVLAFNKVDVTRHEFAVEWMRDFDAFQRALDLDSSYAASLSRSLALVLEEFYEKLHAVGVSSVTGEGMDALCQAIAGGAEEYSQFYKPDLDAKRAERQSQEQARAQADLERVRRDVASGQRGQSEVLIGPALAQDEAADNDDEDGD